MAETSELRLFARVEANTGHPAQQTCADWEKLRPFLRSKKKVAIRLCPQGPHAPKGRVASSSTTSPLRKGDPVPRTSQLAVRVDQGAQLLLRQMPAVVVAAVVLFRLHGPVAAAEPLGARSRISTVDGFLRSEGREPSLEYLAGSHH